MTCRKIMSELELSIIMPCLNEADTIGHCVNEAHRFLNENSVKGEVIVGDNGSTDGSIDIAMSHGARLINVSEKGYGEFFMNCLIIILFNE